MSAPISGAAPSRQAVCSERARASACGSAVRRLSARLCHRLAPHEPVLWRPPLCAPASRSGSTKSRIRKPKPGAGSFPGKISGANRFACQSHASWPCPLPARGACCCCCCCRRRRRRRRRRRCCCCCAMSTPDSCSHPTTARAAQCVAHVARAGAWSLTRSIGAQCSSLLLPPPCCPAVATHHPPAHAPLLLVHTCHVLLGRIESSPFHTPLLLLATCRAIHHTQNALSKALHTNLHRFWPAPT